MKDDGWRRGASRQVWQAGVDHLESFILKRTVYYG
jgi:hypothetical protein